MSFGNKGGGGGATTGTTGGTTVSTTIFQTITEGTTYAGGASDGELVYITDEATMYHVSQAGLVPWITTVDAAALTDTGFVADQILVTDGFGSFLYEPKPAGGSKSAFSYYNETDQTGTSLTWDIVANDVNVLDDFVLSGDNIVVPRDGRYEVSVSGGIENISSASENTVFTRIQKVEGISNAITNEASSSFKTLYIAGGTRSGSSVSVNYILNLVAGDAIRINSAGTATTRINNKILTIKEL